MVAINKQGNSKNDFLKEDTNESGSNGKKIKSALIILTQLFAYLKYTLKWRTRVACPIHIGTLHPFFNNKDNMVDDIFLFLHKNLQVTIQTIHFLAIFALIQVTVRVTMWMEHADLF